MKLADGKERTIQHMMMTTFWHPDGTPMSAQQFMELLFGKLRDFFQSDLFDVLAYVAYTTPTVTRAVRANHARVHINSQFNTKQQAFLDFGLQHYVTEGVQELEQCKLNPLLRLKYHDSTTDAVADLCGKPEQITKAFAGFQKYLYAETA